LPVGKGKAEDAEMRGARRVIQACLSVVFIPLMPDAAAATAPSGESAEAALAFLAEMSPDLRGAAVLGPAGEVLAASGEERERWGEDAAALLATADAAEEAPVEQVHIATEQGEVFAIRHDGLVAVAVTERFALASLMLFDMRSMLRELGRGTA
jgi:predicted regulator of Ras-like GTPase activity (Roadblock/LC7/MglB family)